MADRVLMVIDTQAGFTRKRNVAGGGPRRPISRIREIVEEERGPGTHAENILGSKVV
jgi:hypothetical protein